MSNIDPQEDGPLLVKGETVIRDQTGAELPSKPMVALCRCGASNSKPYCDGSHVAIGFSTQSDGSALRNTAIRYPGVVDGKDVTVSYTPVLCSHAAECQKGVTAVFDPSRKPWIDVSEGDLPDVLSAVGACPSGALRIEVGALAGPMHLTDGAVDISIEKNGPYRVRNIPLDAEFESEGSSQAKFVLCRCGQSKNKPFCDGTHYEVKWQDGDAP
ncbi:MAG: CDGSH iron-sulfur domain-containing protein [Pseudomonadota bacterium]